MISSMSKIYAIIGRNSGNNMIMSRRRRYFGVRRYQICDIQMSDKMCPKAFRKMVKMVKVSY
jgi:hypothetical protein